MFRRIDRRTFLGRAGALAGVAWAGNLALASPTEVPFAIPLLGDLHFDRWEHHDLQWLRREHPGDIQQVENYCRITRDLTPRLMSQTADACRELQQGGQSIPFVLQLGDLLEGLCGSEQLARLQAREAIEFIQQARLPVPMAITKGNHDVTGPGALAVYGDTLLPFMARDMKADISQASFSQTVGGTLLVFYDAYDRGSLSWFSAMLREHKPRQLIVAIHPPVVPYNARSTWHVYSSPQQQEQRAEFLELLGQHRALVLCGHLHKYSFLARRTRGGRFCQLAISSVASSDDGQPKTSLHGLDSYGPDLVDLEPRHSPDTLALRQASLAAERPWIEHFEYADTWGRATLHLQDGKAAVHVFRGFDQDSWKQIALSNFV